ncbi:MAG: hypothetical protein MJZ84_06830 [Paludibacteraceae bacterium]|nr:hypothetical protein [Paludibacteraceae bacterium]
MNHRLVISIVAIFLLSQILQIFSPASSLSFVSRSAYKVILFVTLIRLTLSAYYAIFAAMAISLALFSILPPYPSVGLTSIKPYKMSLLCKDRVVAARLPYYARRNSLATRNKPIKRGSGVGA